MAILISVSLFLLLMGAITVYGHRRYVRPARYYDQLGGTATVAMPTADKLAGEEGPGLAVSVLQSMGDKVPISPLDASATQRDLLAAGFRSDNAVAVFYGARILATVVFFLLALLFRDYVTHIPALRIVLLFAGAGLGWFGPQLYLDHLVDARRERLRLSLPDALDLMVVSVEAGLALDQSIQHVSRELEGTHKDISDEFKLVNLELRAGKRRADALRNLADRTGEPELRKLIAILVQTDRFGTSISDSLRTHSDFMRVRRRQEAEERAGKVGVKLVFPIFFFILPSMMLVAAGPGLLQIFKYLFPMMKNFQ